MTRVPTLPESCGVAFKEWAGVCEALAEGDQTLILRKGGIAEGPGGFTPDQPVFWLYPTRLHEAQQGLRMSHPPRQTTGSTVALSALAAVDTIGFVEDARSLDALAAFHIWTEETVRKRFEYRSPGLWVLVVRVFRRCEPFAIAAAPEQAGCKTWVMLEPPLETVGAVPVLDDEEFARRRDEIRAMMGTNR